MKYDDFTLEKCGSGITYRVMLILNNLALEDADATLFNFQPTFEDKEK